MKQISDFAKVPAAMQEQAARMKTMFESGSDGEVLKGMFGDMPMQFPGQPPAAGTMPDAEKLMQQLQAIMGQQDQDQPQAGGKNGKI